MDSFEGPSAIDQDSLSELSQSVSQVAGVLFSAGSVIDTLASVVELALKTIEGCDLVGLFMIDGDGVTTPVLTDPMALEIEAAQRRSGEGPSLDAIVHRQMIYADDLRTDLRGPVELVQRRPAKRAKGLRRKRQSTGKMLHQADARARDQLTDRRQQRDRARRRQHLPRAEGVEAVHAH